MSGSYANRVTRVPLDHLVDNPFQPRFGVDDDGIEALVASIREYGFVGHVEVRRNPADPALPLQIVFGHRRVEAAKRAGLATIPAAIVDRSDEQMRRLTFVENAARKDLTYWEEAVFVGEMRRELNLSVRQLAAALGKPKSWVHERLDILRLPEGPLREAAQRDEIAFSAAWLLVQMEPKDRDELFRKVKRGDLNVSDLRALRRARLRPDASEDADIVGHDRGTGLSANTPRPVAAPTARLGTERTSDMGSRSTTSGLALQPSGGRVIEVPLQRAVTPSDSRSDADRSPAPPMNRLSTPADAAARTSVLALVREMEVAARSLQVRLRGLDLNRLTAEEQAALDRAKSGLQTVLAGLR